MGFSKMNYWLMKSEPSEVSIDSLAHSPTKIIEWFGVRNYQARNFMRDKMKRGDQAFFWHSSCKQPGIYGIVSISSKNAHSDSTQFDPQNKYYDRKSTIEKPLWWCVDVKFITKTPYLSIKELKMYSQLENMQVLQKGNRLSITPIHNHEWQFILNLLEIKRLF